MKGERQYIDEGFNLFELQRRDALSLVEELREKGVTVQDIAVLLDNSHAYTSRKINGHTPFTGDDEQRIRDFYYGLSHLTKKCTRRYDSMQELRSGMFVDAVMGEV